MTVAWGAGWDGGMVKFLLKNDFAVVVEKLAKLACCA